MSELFGAIKDAYTRFTRKRGKDVHLPTEGSVYDPTPNGEDAKKPAPAKKYDVAERFTEVARRAREMNKK